MKKLLLQFSVVLFTFSLSAQTQLRRIETIVDKSYPALEVLYKKLHQNPELSLHEEKTAALMSEELKKLGYTVTDRIGGFGLAGVITNGKGPTVLIRADMDGLPVEEKTNLPYASKARGLNAVGADVPVMHACGHDVHMTVFLGTARLLAETKNSWSGTLVFVAQPSEENGFGAEAMFKDDLYKKVPYPDYAIALHNHAQMKAGTIGYNDGPFMASVDMVNITVKGTGGHGAAPHQTIDPIVLSAQMIMAFQTIVSREINPLEPSVVTVGSIHGGSVHNIIPDEVKLQLTVRSYSPMVRAQILAALERKAVNLARQAGLTEEKFPVITINEPRTPATINDKPMTDRLVTMLSKELGKDNVLPMPPSMVGEDFSRFGLQTKKVPISMFWLGTVDPAVFTRSMTDSIPLPTLHSSTFTPLPEPTIKTGIKTMSLAALELLKVQVK